MMEVFIIDDNVQGVFCLIPSHNHIRCVIFKLAKVVDIYLVVL